MTSAQRPQSPLRSRNDVRDRVAQGRGVAGNLLDADPVRVECAHQHAHDILQRGHAGRQRMICHRTSPKGLTGHARVGLPPDSRTYQCGRGANRRSRVAETAFADIAEILHHDFSISSPAVHQEMRTPAGGTRDDDLPSHPPAGSFFRTMMDGESSGSSCVVSVNGGVASCWTEYRLASRARPKSPDAIVSVPTELSDVQNSVRLPECYGRRRTRPRSSPRSQRQVCAQPNDGSPARSRRPSRSSRRRCTRPSSANESSSRGGARIRTGACGLTRCRHLRVAAGVATGPRDSNSPRRHCSRPYRTPKGIRLRDLKAGAGGVMSLRGCA